MSAATVSETQQRFLREVVERVPLDRIVELHLFAPIKQGGTETGVAVLAALQPVVEEEPAEREPEPIELPATEESSATAEEAGSDSAHELELELTDARPIHDVSGAIDRTGAIAELGETSVEAATAAGAGQSADAGVASAEFQRSPHESGAIADLDEVADANVPGSHAHHQLPLVRHVVLTARYRLVLKGPDRGRWEMDIREEADATLVTVDAVVRGVQKRVGDLAEVERLSSTQLAIAVSDTPWRTEQ